VGLFHAAYVATHTDRRLFIADAGNARILSVRLDYHITAKVSLKDVPDQAKKGG
jgi:nitrous oxide reductase